MQMTQETEDAEQDATDESENDLLESAQERLIREMEGISHEDEAGRAVKDMVTSTAWLLPLITPEFKPELTTIYTPKKVEELLTKFGHRLLESQAQWANRWNKRRG